MTRRVDYDSVADQFDKRYERRDYSSISKLLLKFLGARTGGHVLEVGCGTGHWLSQISVLPSTHLGLDPSRGMLQAAVRRQTGAAVAQARAQNLPLTKGSVTRIFCINSLHHFEDKELFVAEAARVLRPGGSILIVGLDPHNGLDRWWIYDYFRQVVEIDKARYPSTVAIRAMLNRHGFTDCRTEVALHFPDRLPGRTALETGRLAKATTSQLAVLTDTEYAEGMGRLVNDIEEAEARGRTFFISADLRVYLTVARRVGD